MSGGLTRWWVVAVPAARLQTSVGAWRSLVAHLNGVQEVERSNRSAPTKNPIVTLVCGFIRPVLRAALGR